MKPTEHYKGNEDLMGFGLFKFFLVIATILAILLGWIGAVIELFKRLIKR